MSGFTTAFDELYACQSAELGVVIVATITGYCTNKPALLSEVSMDDAFLEGTTANEGGFNLKIKQSDMASKPPNGTQVTCNGSATGMTLQVVNPKLVNGIWEIEIADIQNSNS